MVQVLHHKTTATKSQHNRNIKVSSHWDTSFRPRENQITLLFQIFGLKDGDNCDNKLCDRRIHRGITVYGFSLTK